MAYVWQRWLADELRAEVKRLGLDVDVIEVQGWENRGRPASTGSFDPRGPHTKHHTGATSSASNPHPTLQLLLEGRLDLPGPLAQVSTAFNGDIYVLAAGRANHAGRIGKAGVIGMPLGADGNALSIGDEVETNGTQDLPPAQVTSMALVSRVVTAHTGKPVTWVHRHQDISATGKWDIGNRTTQQLRDDAQRLDQEDVMNADQEKKLDQTLQQTRKNGRLTYQRDVKMMDAMGALAGAVDDLAQQVADGATKQQVRKVRGDIDQLRTEVETALADEGGDDTPHA